MNYQNNCNLLPEEIEFSKYRRFKIIQRSSKKALRIQRSSLDAIAAKARMITSGKGRNGKSMNEALLRRHMATI